jgi:hypothetical protein
MGEYRINILENILLQHEDLVETKIKINKNIQEIRKNIREKRKLQVNSLTKELKKYKIIELIILLNSLQEHNQTVYSSYNKSGQ